MSDFVKSENVTHVVTDSKIIITVDFPNGTNQQLKIEKDDFINALKNKFKCQK